MTTLATLKAEIADDLDRTDLTTQIATEISNAIRHYQRRRFYFNETRDEVLTTVEAQKTYTSTDLASIPKFFAIDEMVIEDGTSSYKLEHISQEDWELCTSGSTTSSRPDSYVRFARSLGLYPIPDEAYEIRIIGHIMKDEPASDSEADNVWMTEAFNLLRARVCSQLCLRKIRDTEGAQIHGTAEVSELNRLLAETDVKTGTGILTPTDF